MSQDLHHSLLNHWQLLITVRKNFQCWNVFSPWENKRGSSDNELACCRGSVHLILSLWLLLKTTKTTHYTGCYIQTKLESFYFYKMYKNDVFTRNIEMVWTMLCEKLLFFWKKKAKLGYETVRSLQLASVVSLQKAESLHLWPREVWSWTFCALVLKWE